MTPFFKIVYLSLCICIISQTVQSKEIFFLDPVGVSQSANDNSESHHSPNLLLEDSGYLLTYHIDGINGYNVKTLQLLPDPQFHTIAEYFLFDSSQIPVFPTVESIENLKILYWYNGSIDENTQDTLYEQYLATYTGHVPTENNFNNSHEFYTTNKAYANRPQFIKTDNRIYCEMLRNKLSDPNNNKLEFFLRSFDFENSELYPPILHFSANGKTSMVPYGDSLLLVKSWVFCSNIQNLNCVNWSTGYKAYIIFENRIQSIHALSSAEVSDMTQQPDDVFVRVINNDYLFALRQSNQLMKINYETMRFESVLDLSLHTDKSYKKIIPIQTVDYCIVALIDENNNGTIMRFDQLFQFIDSVSIPFEGAVSEISEFVYDPHKDMLSYAYATNMYESSDISRIFLQSILFDKELIQNPPQDLPSRFTVLQNYPNPFNPSTKINYELPQDGHLVVDVYNMLGQKVSTLYDNNQTAGEHILDWDATSQSSGMYLVKVTFEDNTKSIKALFLK